MVFGIVVDIRSEAKYWAAVRKQRKTQRWLCRTGIHAPLVRFFFWQVCRECFTPATKEQIAQLALNADPKPTRGAK